MNLIPCEASCEVICDYETDCGYEFMAPCEEQTKCRCSLCFKPCCGQHSVLLKENTLVCDECYNPLK